MGAIELIILLVVGLVAGGLGGLLGIGGCVLMMPACRFGFQFSPALAVGTTLTAVVFTAGSGAWKHTRMGNVDWSSALPISISGVIGVLIGSWIFTYLVPYGKVIDLIVGLAFIWAALRMLYEGLFRRQAPQMEGKQVPGSAAAKAGTGGIIGILTGIIGLGGGYALVPSLVYGLKSPMKIAIGTSLASFVWFAIVGAAIKIYQGYVNVPAAIALGVGAAIGAVYGAILMTKVKTATLKALFGIIFLYVSLKYILLYFGIHI
jgi:uncharacterized membrane protein YfcA